MAIVKPPVVPAWAETAAGSPDIVQPTDGFIQAGWPLTSIPPSRGFFNWVLHFAANGIRYLSRFGIVDWDAAETYSVGAIVRDSYLENSFTRRSYFQANGSPTVGLAPHLDTTGWSIVLELPIAESTNWTREIMSWRNALSMRRFRIDHMGYSAGPIIAWEENFDRFAYAAAFPTSGDVWTATILHGAATTRTPGGVPAGSLFPRVELAPPTGNLDGLSVWRIGSCRANTSDLGLSMRWKGAMSEVGTNRTTMAMGLIDAAVSAASDPPVYGAYFHKASSDTNWQCNYRTQSGTLSSIGTSVPPVANTWQDFRIEIQGANVADDGAGKILFYINEALVATMVVDISTLAGISTTPLSPCFTAITTTTGGAAVQLWAACVKYRHNTDTAA